MKALILAAGYGTRLYPLTLDKPKPLLKVGPRPIADHILGSIEKLEDVDQIFVVTNQKFFPHFRDWAKASKSTIPLKIINDKTLSNETRLGAIGDIDLVINQQDIRDDMLVIAGDNLFDLELTDFVKFARSKAPASTVAVRVVKDKEKIKKYGVVVIGKEGNVTDFEEKPKKPKSNLAAMCIYYFPKETLRLIDRYLKSGASKDAPGNYIGWLAKNDTLFGYKFEGEWFDIGDMDSYKLADKIYNERSKGRC